MSETIYQDPQKQAIGVNETLLRAVPQAIETLDILREGSYFFYDFLDTSTVINPETEQRYTKDLYPLFNMKYIDNPDYWDLISIISEDIPFYHLEPTVEQTIVDKSKQFKVITPTGIDLGVQLSIDNYRDPGIVDVPAPLQGSDFWSSWLRDTIGYYENKLILDVYNKLQYPLLNEHLYLNAALFPSLAYAAYKNSGTTDITEILSFKDTLSSSEATSLDDVGAPAYIEDLIDSRLNSIYKILDYSPLSAQILMDWADSLYEVGQLSSSALEKEKTIYRLQDIKHELLKRKFAGTSTLYQLTLRSLNRSGSFISAVPASTIGNSKTAYSVFNERRNIRLINLPGLTSSPVTSQDIPIDYLREFYTRPIEEGTGREIPLDILYPLFCSASNAVSYGLSFDKAASERTDYKEYFYTSNIIDPAKLLVNSSYFFSESYSDPQDPLKVALRSANSSLVWDALEGISMSQSISTIWTTLDEKVYEESEESISTNAYLHLDPMITRTTSGDIIEVQHTLDEQNPYASLSNVTGHILDLTANTLMYHENTFQKKLEDSYEYLTYPITDNLSVSLMDSPWLTYLQQTTDRKSRLQEEIQVGVQISSFNDIPSTQQTEFPFFVWSTGISDSQPSDDPSNTDSVYLWFAILKYFTNEFYFQPDNSQIEYHLMSKIYKAGCLSSSSFPEPTDLDQKALYEEWQYHNVGLMPMIYPDLKALTINNLYYGLKTSAETTILLDDFADQEYTKAYFFFSKSGIQPGRHLRNSSVQPEFLSFADLTIESEKDEQGQQKPDANSVLKKYLLEPWPTDIVKNEIKAIFYVLKKEDLDNLGTYKYSWSDPIPVFNYADLIAEWNSKNSISFYPEWWGLTYQLNPYLNFIQDSASPIRNKLVLSDFQTSTTVSGPSGISALSNLARGHHNGIVCNDNGLLSIFHDTSDTPSLNDLLNLQVTNPYVVPGGEDEEQQKKNNALMGMYLEHGYSIEEGPSIEKIETWSIAEKKSIETPVKIYGDNRELSLYDTLNDISFSKINYSTEKFPCLTFSRPIVPTNKDSQTQTAKLTEYLRFNHKNTRKVSESPTDDNQWCWQPGQKTSLVYKQLYGFTVCMNVSFDFKASSTSYFPGAVPAEIDPAANETQTLLDQPEYFSLIRKAGGEIVFTVKNINGAVFENIEGESIDPYISSVSRNTEDPNEIIDKFLINQDSQPYRITASAYAISEDNKYKAVLILIIDNKLFTVKIDASEATSLETVFTSVNNSDMSQNNDSKVKPIYIGTSYTPAKEASEGEEAEPEKFSNQFYGNIYDLRCYTVGFEPGQLLLMNNGTLSELYSYGPSSYKLAYSVYKDPSILKTLTLDITDWSVKKVRVFSRSVWDSILPDLYPQSLMEKSSKYWQYITDYYDPLSDTDIYKQYYNVDLDLTPQQAVTLTEATTQEEKQALLRSWNLVVPASAPTENYEYNDCVEQTLKDKAEVINSSSPIGFPDGAHPEYVQVKYHGNSHNVYQNDTVSIINTTIYPVQYEHWPYISFNPEENKTPSLSVDLSTGAISTLNNRGFYLPTTVESVDDNIEYNTDLDINFKVLPDMSTVRAYSYGDNIQIRYNEDLQVTQTIHNAHDINHNSSDNNHILFPLTIPRQKNINSEETGFLKRFYLKNFSLHSALKHFLSATSYYTELYIPIPYSEPNAQNQIHFGSRWHALRTLKEGSYYFTCKYPVQVIPLIDKDFDTIPNQSSIITSYLTVRFKIEVSGKPYIPSQSIDNEILEFGLNSISASQSISAKHASYLSENLQETLSNPNKLYSPSDNFTFPHRQITINLFAQDYSTTGGQGSNPKDYTWTLIGTNDSEIQKKFKNALLLNKEALQNPEINFAIEIPAFLQKNYILPFFIANNEDGNPDPSSPVADNFYWTIDPMGNSASIEHLTASTEADYSNELLSLVAGHSYKILLDYTGKLTELAFDDAAAITTESVNNIFTNYVFTRFDDETDEDIKAAKVSRALAEVTDLSDSLIRIALTDKEISAYPRLVNLLSSSVISGSIFTEDFCYTATGTKVRQNDTNIRVNFSGYQVDFNEEGQQTFKAISTAPEPLIPADESIAAATAFYLGDPYSLIRSQNYKLQIALDNSTAPTNINQAYTFPYVIENYNTSNLFTAYPRTSLPAITGVKNGNSVSLPSILSTEIAINETEILATLHSHLMTQLNINLNTLISDFSGIITGLSDIAPDIRYPRISGYAQYSYIKSVNEDLLGYSAMSRQLSLNTAPFSLTRSSLYTGNLFASRNLFDSRYWARGSALSDGATAMSLVSDSTYALVPDEDWFNGKDVFEWQYTPVLNPQEEQTSNSDKILLTVAYTPNSTSTIQDPLEIYIALKTQISTLTETSEEIQDLSPATSNIEVTAQLSRGSRTIDTFYVTPTSDVEVVSLTREAEPVEETNGKYYGYKAVVVPSKPCDRLAFVISVPATILSSLTNGSLQVRIGKVSVRRYKKDLKLAVGLSSALKYGAAANTKETIFLKGHSIVLFKNKFNSRIITPVQFNGQVMKTIVDPSTGVVIDRALTAGSIDANTFIDKYHLRKLGPYSPYTLLAKPWIRKLVLTHQYVPLEAGSVLGDDFLNQGENFRKYATLPIRCSSTQAEIHKYEIDVDSNGIRYLLDKGQIYDIYQFKKSLAGDGVVYRDSRDSDATTSFFEIKSKVDSETGDEVGLFLTKDSVLTKNFSAVFNSNLQVDDTLQGIHRYHYKEGSDIDDTYGTFSISNERLSLLTSTFNTKNFSKESNRQAIDSSPVLVTNVQLLNVITDPTSSTIKNVNQLLYEYEFLPIIYDEKGQHLSLNYFLRYGSDMITPKENSENEESEESEESPDNSEES